ncbi:hypothetical protein [Nocardioides sp. SR21]|uniref:hypothetical protein n=1 Tax=Nocardioides sp. SR21 TaxID=2919501 RepID=UPI001FAA5042|nr:hypothetical protein [Nocardioides sp. SR21]
MSHPRLRPGLHVVRRDDDHLQVGVDPPWRLVLPDRPDVRRLLDDLVSGRPPVPDSPQAHRALADLGRAGLLVESPAPRGAARVAVEGGSAVATEAARILRAAGCDLVPAEDAEVALALADGEPVRADVDAHVRDGRAHLVVAASAYGFTIGPFVVPGWTACLRCVDAHLGQHDPRRAVVVEQVGGLAVESHDPGLTALVAAWAVRDVLTHAEGGRPSTWSATVAVGADLAPRTHAWLRHPHCGCSWADGVAV